MMSKVLSFTANIAIAAASGIFKAVLLPSPDTIIFYHCGKGSYVGKFSLVLKCPFIGPMKV